MTCSPEPACQSRPVPSSPAVANREPGPKAIPAQIR
jgi:hypothetical protein